MYGDARLKKGQFIGKINSLQQEFYFVNPAVKVDLYDKYACSFYGSNLYNLFCHETERIYCAFNVAIRQAYSLPFNAHRYLIEPLLERPHLKIQLCSRFVKFVNSNDNCNKPVIRLLSALCKSDNRTTYCNNLFNIANECNLKIAVDSINNTISTRPIMLIKLYMSPLYISAKSLPSSDGKKSWNTFYNRF